MEKLNELAELAQAMMNAETRKEAFSIGEEFTLAASTNAILAIAEAFRALEQRAEAAEANYANEADARKQVERNYALLEAKLAELERQKPVGTVSIAMDWNTHRNIATVNMRPDLVVAEMKDGDELFTRPAPAINLAELVPDGFVMVPRALTAKNGAKAALSGEFNLEYDLVCHECFGEGCDDCSGEGRWTNSIPVDWTTIKEIWAKGVEHFQAALEAK
ncbi:hypothetical protein [Pantoea piersonii]|uniref:hypothetical protein n=1 Tax=Pantoea piersonii TaxID=2364647 RepID=UPI0028995864|nr:hypothetical protein [Pantoea piersonii]